MSQIIQSERRRAERVPLTVTMRYATYHSDDDNSILENARAVDLSRTGVQILLETPLPIPVYMQVAIRMPDRTAPIILLGKSIWSRPEGEKHRAGVQFLGHIDTAFFDYLDSLPR
jgi:c-di-GMP-binding flagellar brake protein YcgR